MTDERQGYNIGAVDDMQGLRLDDMQGLRLDDMQSLRFDDMHSRGE